MYIHSRACRAYLSGVVHNSRDDLRSVRCEVYIGHDYGWRLPTEFEGYSLQVSDACSDDLATGLSGAGERYLVDRFMGTQRCTGLLAEPGNHVEHARWDSSLARKSG